jgi:pseudaminic acid cytidylyltransferase
MTNNTVAIITARGGSKRIPRKNIKYFLGKPIIAYSIEAALNAGCFDEVMVSTDDNEIAEIAIQLGAKVPFLRSSTSSNDFATTAEVIVEVLNSYKQIGRNFSEACCIYPTAPFVDSKKLKNAMELLRSSDSDSVIPVTEFSFPILRSFKMDENSKVEFNWPENALKRSQDLPKAYHDCGQFYCINVQRFLQHKKLVTDNTSAIVMPNTEVQDIDNEEDWTLAEIKYSFLQKQKN